MVGQIIIDRFEEKYIPETNSGCWLWIGAWDSHGYGHINIEGKILKAHRVSWLIHRGPIPEGLCVLHKCDTPSCVNPGHLFLGTLKDNTQDMVKKGRSFTGDQRGEKNGNAKLNQRQVKEIRSSISSGLSQSVIAKKYGVAKPTIGKISTGKTWGYI